MHGIGLAEAGLLSSKLSILELGITDSEDKDKILFSPERYIFGNYFHNINYYFGCFLTNSALTAPFHGKISLVGRWLWRNGTCQKLTEMYAKDSSLNILRIENYVFCIIWRALR